MISVENHEQCGYTSEKLMRGLRFGLVPVYLGDPCIGDFTFGFSNTKWFIDAHDFQSPDRLGAYLLEIDGTAEFDELLSWRTALKRPETSLQSSSQGGNAQSGWNRTAA